MAYIISADEIKKNLPNYSPKKAELFHHESARLADQQFEIALNTIDKAGTLDEVSVAYQCWSPENGQITHDCKLSVE